MKNHKISDKLAQFMSGRYGNDDLNRFLSIAGIVLMLLSIVVKKVSFLSSLLFALALVLIVFLYIRTFSRNFSKRQAENQRYWEIRDRITGFFSGSKEKFSQRKEYVFFRCPGCKRTVRVPRGKGRIRITCRSCGYSFIKKT